MWTDFSNYFISICGGQTVRNGGRLWLIATRHDWLIYMRRRTLEEDRIKSVQSDAKLRCEIWLFECLTSQHFSKDIQCTSNAKSFIFSKCVSEMLSSVSIYCTILHHSLCSKFIVSHQHIHTHASSCAHAPGCVSDALPNACRCQLSLLLISHQYINFGRILHRFCDAAA